MYDSFWLNATNATLGILTLLCLAVAAFAIAREFIGNKRGGAANLYTMPAMGDTMPAMGDEKTRR